MGSRDEICKIQHHFTFEYSATFVFASCAEQFYFRAQFILQKKKKNHPIKLNLWLINLVFRSCKVLKIVSSLRRPQKTKLRIAISSIGKLPQSILIFSGNELRIFSTKKEHSKARTDFIIEINGRWIRGIGRGLQFGVVSNFSNFTTRFGSQSCLSGSNLSPRVARKSSRFLND